MTAGKENFKNTGEGHIDSITEKNGTLHLAEAMTSRTLKEYERVGMRLSELTGEKHRLPGPIYTGAIIFVGAKIYEKILTMKPSLLPSTPQKLAATTYLDDLSNDLLEEDRKQTGQRSATESKKARLLLKEIAGEVFEKLFPFPGEKGAFTHLLNEVKIAKEMGEKMGINPAEVYLNDELYLQLCRQSESLSKMAKDAIETLKTVTPEEMTKLQVNKFRSMSRILNGLKENSISSEEIERKVREKEDPEFKREMREKAGEYKKALKTVMVEDIVRLWGQKGFDSLPGLTRTILKGEEKIDRIAY